MEKGAAEHFEQNLDLLAGERRGEIDAVFLEDP